MIELINETTIQDIQAKYYPNINVNVLKNLNTASPDYNESQPDRKTVYLPWLIKLYLNKDYYAVCLGDEGRFSEGFRKGLMRFEQIKNEIPLEERDINKYKSAEDLNNFYNKYKDYVTQKEQKQIIKNETKVLYDTPDWKIISPLTFESSKFWGLHTKWCTAWHNNRSYYDEYTSKGPLYVNIDKRNNKKWQFHFETASFYDEQDIKIDEIYMRNHYLNDTSSVADVCNMPKEVVEWYQKNIKNGEQINIPINDIKEPKYWPGDNSVFICELPGGNESIYLVEDGNSGFYNLERGEVGGNQFLDDNPGIKITENRYTENSIYERGDYMYILMNSDDKYDLIYLDENNELTVKTDLNNYDGENDFYIFSTYDEVMTLDGLRNNSTITYDYYEDFILLPDLECFALTYEGDKYDLFRYFDDEPIIGDIELIDGDIKIDNKGYVYTYSDDNVLLKSSHPINSGYLGKIEWEDANPIKESRYSFWKTLNKINEINRRNCDDRID